MRLLCRLLLLYICAGLLLACVDPLDLRLRGTNDVLVVDGTITNLAEPQIIKLNRSKADPVTGRFGTRPITKATVEVVVDSSLVIACHETVDGSYQLPSDFKGQIGHAYQLRFTLTDGTRYLSSQQVIADVPPIAAVDARFNPRSLSIPLEGSFTAGHDIFMDVNDPADQHNYYRWDWTLYEPQKWCRTCVNGFYSIFNPIDTISSRFYKSGPNLFEECFYPPTTPGLENEYRFDYPCRTQCWEIFHNYTINVLDDQLINGGSFSKRRIAQIPFYQSGPCLVEIRQLSMTKDAYRYYKLFQDQTENTGGLADTPPSALVGNVHNVANTNEVVIGYFTAAAVSTKSHYIDRKDTEGRSFGSVINPDPPKFDGEELFYALNRRTPNGEPSPPNDIRLFLDGTPRPPTAICGPIDQRTPVKPPGWPE